MKKYTIKSIKNTNVYKSNIAAVNAIYPGHGEDFARELMIAANSIRRIDLNCIRRIDLNCISIVGVFLWHLAPQSYMPWRKIYTEIRNFNNNNSVNK